MKFSKCTFFLTALFICLILPNVLQAQPVAASTSNTDSVIDSINRSNAKLRLAGELTVVNDKNYIELEKSINSASTTKGWGYASLSVGLLFTASTLYSIYNEFTYNAGMNFPDNRILIASGLALGLDFLGFHLISKSNRDIKKAIFKFKGATSKPEDKVSLNVGLNRLYLTVNLD